MLSLMIVLIGAILYANSIICHQEFNSASSSSGLLVAKDGESFLCAKNFNCGFIRYAADGVFTGFCGLCHSLMQDNERVFAFHAKQSSNISKHLYHGKCLYAHWKKNKRLVGFCPNCFKLNPNQGPQSSEKNHAAICVLADRLDEDSIDQRLSAWILNLKPENVHEVICEFIAAADNQEKQHLIIPFVKTMLKKRIMKLRREEHIAEIVRNLDGVPGVQRQALIEWKNEIWRYLERIPESTSSSPEKEDFHAIEIPETSKYIISKLNNQVVVNPNPNRQLAEAYQKNSQSISRKNSYIYIQKINQEGEFQAGKSGFSVPEEKEFLHSEEAATVLIKRYPWENIGTLFTSEAFRQLAMNTRNYDNLIWMSLNERSNFELYSAFCPYVRKFIVEEILKMYHFPGGDNDKENGIKYVRELVKHIEDHSIIAHLLVTWYKPQEFAKIVSNFAFKLTEIRCIFSNAALAYYFIESFLQVQTVSAHKLMGEIVKKCNFPSLLVLKKRLSTLGIKNFEITLNENDISTCHFMPLIHNYEPKMDMIEILEEFENVAQQWMPFFHEIFYISCILSPISERKKFVWYLRNNVAAKKVTLSQKQMNFIRDFDFNFGKFANSKGLLDFMRTIMEIVEDVNVSGGAKKKQ